MTLERLRGESKSTASRQEKEKLFPLLVTCMDEIATMNEILRTAPGADQLTDRVPRKSKRRLRKVPENWREILASRIVRWKTPFLVTAITGCRPVELVRGGVEISILGSDLIVTVNGAKLTDYSGQPQRTLTWSLDHPSKLVSDLVKIVQNSGGGLLVKMPSDSRRAEAAFSTNIRDAAKRAFPNLSTTITPYSLRHALASDLKAAGFSKVQIAQGLGHISTDTQNTYGHTNAARGVSLAPREVSASREVHAGSQKPMPVFGMPKTESESMRG